MRLGWPAVGLGGGSPVQDQTGSWRGSSNAQLWAEVDGSEALSWLVSCSLVLPLSHFSSQMFSVSWPGDRVRGGFAVVVQWGFGVEEVVQMVPQEAGGI